MSPFLVVTAAWDLGHLTFSIAHHPLTPANRPQVPTEPRGMGRITEAGECQRLLVLIPGDFTLMSPRHLVVTCILFLEQKPIAQLLASAP